MGIDNSTRRNLELARTLNGESQGSLLSVIDKTITGAGARMLATRLSEPLTNFERINDRLDAVDALADAHQLRENVRAVLRKCPDMVRALSRLTLARGGPRDLAAVRDGLICAHDVRDLLQVEGGDGLITEVPNLLAANTVDLGYHNVLIDLLRAALEEDLPLNVRDGGYIARTYSNELDELVSLRDESRKLIISLQARYAADTGLSGLKVKYNRVLGYFIEVPARQAEKMPSQVNGDGESVYIHRQTMANAVRYTTIELGELESRIAKAADQALALELELFEALIAEIVKVDQEIAIAANALAEIDVSAGLAELAVKRRYVRPVVDESHAFHIVGGRHPVVEVALEAKGGSFVPNECHFDEVLDDEAKQGDTSQGRVWLLTGPNMAGKSTFLRQNALIAIMAQMGSFVPAQTAQIGIIDSVFSRVGAADDLARGRSTFMVEMVETASILNQAGERAFVILDEIGRGTSTYDGLSIAWSVVEYLHNHNKCRALFATHYHELTALANSLDKLRCFTMRVKDWKGEVVFLHEVKAGVADRSYGIHVGKLAGLPRAVVMRANAVLKLLETDEVSSTLHSLTEDLPLFQNTGEKTADLDSGLLKAGVVEKAITDIAPDEISPREALEFIYELKRLQQNRP